MYEKLENGTRVISCTACSAVCMVASDDATLGNPDNPEDPRPPKAVAGRVYIRLRRGQTDWRARREVDARPGDNSGPAADTGEVTFQGGKIIFVREYAFLCDDCYETGGVKLDSTWRRHVFKPCGTCGNLTHAWGDEDAVCETCGGFKRPSWHR